MPIAWQSDGHHVSKARKSQSAGSGLVNVARPQGSPSYR